MRTAFGPTFVRHCGKSRVRQAGPSLPGRTSQPAATGDQNVCHNHCHDDGSYGNVPSLSHMGPHVRFALRRKSRLASSSLPGKNYKFLHNLQILHLMISGCAVFFAEGDDWRWCCDRSWSCRSGTGGRRATTVLGRSLIRRSSDDITHRAGACGVE